jgi:hypothetical protein
MSVVLVVILSASALAFFGCFFLGLCRDARHASDTEVVEVVTPSEQSRTDEMHNRKSA